MTAVLLMVMKNRDKQNTSKPNHHPKMACKTAGLRRQCEVWVCIAAAQRGANKPSFSIGSTWKREDFPGFGVDMHWNCGCFYTISIYIPKFHSRICENISSARWNMMEQLGNIETACTDFIRFLERCSSPCLKLGYPRFPWIGHMHIHFSPWSRGDTELLDRPKSLEYGVCTFVANHACWMVHTNPFLVMKKQSGQCIPFGSQTWLDWISKISYEIFLRLDLESLTLD